MRILGLTNLFPNPYQTDRATFNRRQFRALAAMNSVSIISPIAWTDELAARWRGSAQIPRNRQVLCDGIEVNHPLYFYTPKILRNWYGEFFRGSVRRVFEGAVADFRPDIVLSAWAYPDGWAAVELGGAAGLPVVVKVHGCDILNGGRGLDRDPGRKRRTIETLRRADMVVAVSQHLAERVVGFGVDPSRVQVVYDGIDTGLFHPGDQLAARMRLGLDAQIPVVLFVGNLVKVKGTEILLEACARLIRDGLRFECYLIGEGPLGPRLARQITELGLDGRVRLLGPVSNDRLPDWYRSTSVFVLPSYSEGVPNVLLEAMACGTQFVASRVGGIPEIAHFGAGRLVQAGDSEGLSQAISDALAGPFDHTTGSFPFSRCDTEAASELIRLFERVIRVHDRKPSNRIRPVSRHGSDGEENSLVRGPSR